MTSWQESSGAAADHGVLGVPVQETQHGLAVWQDPAQVGQVAVGQVFRPEGIDLFAGEPLDLAETQVSSTDIYLGGLAAQLLVQRRQAEAAAGPQPVEISLEAAIQDPESILDMIRSAPLSDFHERVLRADKRTFEARFRGYIEDERPGLWVSLELDVPGETSAARMRTGMSPRKARKTNLETIGEFQREDLSPLSTATENSLATGGVLYGRVHRHILMLDDRYEKGQAQAGTGLVRLALNPRTQERLERLSAVRYPHAVEEAGPRRRHHNADMLKLEGLGHTIKRLWARHHKEPLLSSMASGDLAEPVVGLPDELLDAEALYTALLAEYRLKTGGRKAVIAEMAASINSMEEIRGGMEETASAQKDEGLFRLDLGTFGEQAFRRAIQIAGASWQVMKQLDQPNLAAFEAELLKNIKSELAGYGLLGEAQDRSGLAAGHRTALPAAVRAAMDAGHFEGQAAEALAEMAASGVLGKADRELIERYLRAKGDAAVRDDDDGGRYGEQQDRLIGAAAAERRAEDYPGAGRLLTFYGSYWTNDGGTGPLEAMAAVSGAYEHIDSVGRSPTMDADVRRQLERLSGGTLQVHAPFKNLPEGYLCETAHFVGRLSRLFKPQNVLSIVIPNGLATIQEDLNPGLARQIQLSGASARYRSIPTGLVRFLRSPRDGSLQFVPGHSDPEIQEQLEGQEQTLAIFFDKEDGTPSDLFQLLYPQEAAALLTRPTPDS